jgi:acyl-CoA thioester hydrolase
METPKRPSYEVALKVPFYDLDPMQIVWHGNYLKYFDIARSELFDHLGVDLFAFHDKTRYIFPIIRTAVKHIRPLKRGDEFVCRAVRGPHKIVILFSYARQGRDPLRRGSAEQVSVREPEIDGIFDPGGDRPGAGRLTWMRHSPA